MFRIGVCHNSFTFIKPFVFQRRETAFIPSPTFFSWRIARPYSDQPVTAFTLNQIASHNSRNDLWIAIEDGVYDVTKFYDSHPGGEILLEFAGSDATQQFNDVGHSDEARELLKNFLIGKLIH